MLGERGHWRGGFLSSRLALLAAMMSWCFLTGVISTKLLMPPAPQKRSASVGTTVMSLFVAPPRETTPSMPPLHSGPDVRVKAAVGDDLRPEALATSQSTFGVAGLTVMSSGGASTQDDLRDKHAGIAQTSAVPPMSVLFLYRAGSVAGRAAAQQLAGEAHRAGVDVAGITAVPVVPKTREVRYLRSGDAAEGRRLASRFQARWGNVWQVREPGSDTKWPGYFATGQAPAHTLEVWLPHR
jgi:hypothetical protein